jgi:23S rRNA pseudouridine2605 synthase
MANDRPPPRKGSAPPYRRGPSSGGPRRPPDANRPPREHKAEAREDQDGPDRLQKVLAHAGVGSRRSCEEMILQGRITIDGRIVRELGTRVDPLRSKVAVDGQAIHAERPVYFAVHKPKGYVSTNSDPAGKPRVVDLLPEIPQRVYTVGRLDEQSTGLLLLTNDGELANKLAHPKFGVEKIYRVVVAGEPPREVLDKLTQGLWIAEGKVRAKRVRVIGRKGQASVLELVLAEGKNREIRRMLAQLGHKVMALTRIAVGPIGLKGLPVGGCRPLNGAEVELLRKVAAGKNVASPRFPDRRDRTPRPTGSRRPAGRPPERASTGRAGGEGPPPRPRPGAENRPGQAPRPRPTGMPQGGPPRPAQGPANRPAGNQGARRPATSGRPPRPAQHGPSGGGPPPNRARRPPAPSARPEVPTRRIIGMEHDAGQTGGESGPRMRRPAPKRAPRAALGVKRTAKRPKPSED